MSLRDRLINDVSRVFMNQNQFAEKHTWNGKQIVIVPDEEAALKRKNNNVVDVAWDNNTTEVLIYTPVEGFPGRVEPNEHILFDNKPMKVLQANKVYGMYAILLVSFDPKAVGFP